MKKILLFMFVLIPLFLGCKKGESSWELTVVDYGAEYPTPAVSTTAMTSAGSINYTDELRTEFGDGDVVATLAEWSTDISEEDLSSLNDLIDDADLINQGDIGADEPPCVGGQGMSVYFATDSEDENEFQISGGSAYFCGDDDAIPEELDELLSFVNDLVETYGS